MLDFLKMLLTPEFFFSIIRISAPILFATLAAIVVEKAGFCNIGLEGLMMFSALTGSLVFGFAQALGIKFSAVGLDSNLASPIPYAVTIIGLVIFSLVRRSRAKKLHSAAALK